MSSADDYEVTFEDDHGGLIRLKPAWAYGTGMVFLTLDPNTVGGVYPRKQAVVHIDKLDDAVQQIKNGGGLG